MLKEDLIASNLGDDPSLAGAVATAFPARLVERFAEDINEHRLYREIMCTQVANDIVNRMGPTFVSRQRRSAGASVADVARAYSAVMATYELPEMWEDIEALDYQVPAEAQLDMMLDLIRLVKRAVRWLLRNRRNRNAPSNVTEEFYDGVMLLLREMPGLLRGKAAESFERQRAHYSDQGVPEPMARKFALSGEAATALAIIEAAARNEADLLEHASLYYQLGERLELDWFGEQILASKVENEWQALAREAYLEDLQWQQCTLTESILKLRRTDLDMAGCLATWEDRQGSLIQRWRDMLGELHSASSPDFAMFAVANRELLDLAQSSRFTEAAA
jgi:glutamate dehydrogenase